MKYCLSVLFIFCLSCVSAQHSIRLDIRDQPFDKLYLVSIKGDKTSVLDTIYWTRGGFYYAIPESMNTGVYRIFLTPIKTSQKLKDHHYIDIIYNNEDIKLHTAFVSPLDSVRVIISQENKVWFSFQKKMESLRKEITKLESEINHFQQNLKDSYYTDWRKKSIIDQFNTVQKERILFLKKISDENEGLFVSRLIRMYAEPFLDGNKTSQARKDIKINNYFNNLDFSDETLLNSGIYTERMFEYFMLYAQKGLSQQEQEREFKRALDVILKKTKSNDNVSVFIVDYFMRGFESLGLNSLLDYLSSNFLVPHGCSGDTDTLEKRLGFQKLQVGNEMPDFSLMDLTDAKISLKDFDSTYKLVLFWETTCPLCKEILPQLKSWYLSKDIDIEVFAISIDEDVEQWKEFVLQKDYPWISLNEPHKWDGPVASSYYLYATPTMYLLDNKNRLVAKCISFEEFMDLVPDLYK